MAVRMASGDDDSGAIARVPGGARVVRLRKQHSELVAKLRRKRRGLGRLRDEGEAVARELDTRTSAMRRERFGYDSEAHAAFETALRAPGLARSDRQAVRFLYRWLQRAGALSARATETADPVEDAPTAEPAAAPAMRPTFLRLANAYHPDKTTDPSERDRNTEIMKELNRAYREADVSRLLEIEQTLDDDTEQAAPLDPATLATQVAALRKQLRNMSREMSDLRGQYVGAIALERRRLSAAGDPDPVAVLVDEVRQVTAQTQRVRDLAQGFASGDVDLDDLFAGPPSDEHDWLDDVFESARERRPTRRSKR